MFKKVILIFAIAILGFLIWTYFNPWEMLWDTVRCGESPIGFYRFEIVPFELTDYGGTEVQTGTPIGGVWEFVKFYLGRYKLCN